MIDENKGVPNIPEALVFDDISDAYDWTKSLQMDLSTMRWIPFTGGVQQLDGLLVHAIMLEPL